MVSILERWPHQFGGRGNRNHMVGDLVRSGTALTPPVFLLVLFAMQPRCSPTQDTGHHRHRRHPPRRHRDDHRLGEGTGAATRDSPRCVQVFGVPIARCCVSTIPTRALLVAPPRRRLQTRRSTRSSPRTRFSATRVAEHATTTAPAQPDQDPGAPHRTPFQRTDPTHRQSRPVQCAGTLPAGSQHPRPRAFARPEYPRSNPASASRPATEVSPRHSGLLETSGRAGVGET